LADRGAWPPVRWRGWPCWRALYGLAPALTLTPGVACLAVTARRLVSL
jgi:hypothetical protein